MITRAFSKALVGFAAVVGISATGVAPAQASETGAIPVVSSSPCQDVVVIGAQGSGQTLADNKGFGPEVWHGLTTYAARMEGYKVGHYAIPYPAAGVWTLATAETRDTFFASIDTGVEDTLKFLAKRQEKCGTLNERYVLMGYSQGAMVMHRVLWQLARASTKYHTLGRQILPRLDGILAIADGDKVANQGGVSYDTAPDAGAGIWWDQVDGALVKDLLKIKTKTKYLPVNAPIPNLSYWPATRFHSVCHASDLVCDWGSLNFSQAIKIHESYYRPAGDSEVYVRSAATTIARTSKENIPRPPAVTPTVLVRVGQTGTAVLTPDLRDVASVEWLSAPIPNTQISIGMPTVPATLTWSPTAPGVVNYSVRVNFTDGTSSDVSGALQAFAVPSPSLSVTNLQTAYSTDPLVTSPFSTVTFDVIKTTSSDTTPGKGFVDREDPASDWYYYTGGDSNGDGLLDVGESWSYKARIEWGYWEPADVRTRTVLIDANDTTGAGAWTELELPVTLTR